MSEITFLHSSKLHFNPFPWGIHKRRNLAAIYAKVSWLTQIIQPALNNGTASYPKKRGIFLADAHFTSHVVQPVRQAIYKQFVTWLTFSAQYCATEIVHTPNTISNILNLVHPSEQIGDERGGRPFLRNTKTKVNPHSFQHIGE